MPPGKVHVVLFDVLIHDELPQRYDVTVRYRSDRGEYPPDTFPLDLGVYADLEQIDRSPWKDLKGELDKLTGVLRAWSQRTERGILVLSPKDVRRRQAATRRRFRDRPHSSFAPPGAGESRGKAALRRVRERAHDVLLDAAEKVRPQDVR
jgi:hypothetical protein